MQLSLRRVLTPTKVDRLGELGWRLDPSFGNYERTFPSGEPADKIADAIIQALADGYDADIVEIQRLRVNLDREIFVVFDTGF